jgi:acyl-homoserine-lactone acylase
LEAFDSEWKGYLEAFAAGVNDYTKEHQVQIDPDFRQVLPVNAVDILAHCHRVTHFAFLASPARVKSTLTASGDQIGSNAWAIGPNRTASGSTMLLTNPHLPWTDYFTYFEAHINGPGTNAYGISRIGFPVLTMAFNSQAGYAQTVNTHDGQDLFELTLQEGGYLWDGNVSTFRTWNRTLKVRMEDGTHVEEMLQLKASVHGPVVEEKDGNAYALRVVGLDQPRMLQQYWNMCRAKDHGEFIAAIRDLQIPMYTFMFADNQGNIFNLFNARVPKRPLGDWAYWTGIVPGHSSETLWTEYHSFDELPQVHNPPSGWLQNTNEPPWTATWPMVNRPENFPDYMAPEAKMSFRTMASIDMLMTHDQLTMDQLIALKHSTRLGLADHILDDLIAASGRSSDTILNEAANVLNIWDRLTEAESQGAFLFDRFVREWVGGTAKLGALSNLADLFEIPWDENSPLDTPKGFKDIDAALSALKSVSESIRSTYGRLDVPWGEIYRFKWAGLDLPGNGGPGPMGAFRTMTLGPSQGNTFIPAHGDTYVALVEFTNPLKIMALTSYGNSSQPNIPYAGLQLPLLEKKQLREVFMDMESLLPHVVEVTEF